LLLKRLQKQTVFKIISEVSTALQIKSYIVGGYVRDLLLQKASKDIDILVLGEGVYFAEEVAKRMGESAKVVYFKNFGTAQLKYKDYEIEFVGARKESYRADSRKPIVEQGTFDEDILRRDFTINALAISLNKENFGELTDLFTGIEDLKNKLIRTPQNPNLTFSDDPLRMMRAVRFACQLGFSLHDDILDAIEHQRERISIISKERITDELNKIIASQQPSVGFRILFNTQLLHLIFPELAQLQGIDYINNKGHKDNFYHTLQVLDSVAEKSDNLWLRWAALLHDIAKPITKKYTDKEGWSFHGHEFIGEKMALQIFRKLRLPTGDNLKYVQKLIRLHLRPIVLAESDITDSAIRRLLFEAGNDIEDLLLLCEADITSKNEIKVQKYTNNLKLVKIKLNEIEEKDRIREFQPPISGEEIMKIFDLQPCREVGIIKSAIKDAILDGIISNNYKEAYNYMLEVAKKNNIYPLKN